MKDTFFSFLNTVMHKLDFCALDQGSSINDVTQYLVTFDTPCPHRQAFKYYGFSTVVTKSLIPLPLKTVTSSIDETLGNKCLQGIPIQANERFTVVDQFHSLLGVNFINVKRARFSYECSFGSFSLRSYIRFLATNSYKKRAPKTLMKLTPIRECCMQKRLRGGCQDLGDTFNLTANEMLLKVNIQHTILLICPYRISFLSSNFAELFLSKVDVT